MMNAGRRGGGKEGVGPASPRTTWVEVKDDDGRRRDKELQLVEFFLQRLHHNPDNGLFNVVGPSMGLTGENCVLGLDGDVLGNANKAYGGLKDKDARILDVPEPLQRKIGAPDFPAIQYGLYPGRGTEVWAAKYTNTITELTYPAETHDSTPTSKQQHPKSGEVKMIGRIALRDPDKMRASRILVVGGQRKSRDDLIRWYCGVRRFGYGAEREALETALNELKTKAKSEDNSSVKSAGTDKDKGAAKPQPAGGKVDTPEALEAKIQRLDQNFQVISTWRNAEREREYRALVKDLEEKKKETEGSNKSEEMESVRSGDDDEFEKEEKLKGLREDIAKLEKEIASFGHVQGCHTPFAELIDPGKSLGAGWTKVGGDKAMALLYYGAAARSTLSAYGTLTDFTNQARQRIRCLGTTSPQPPGQSVLTRPRAGPPAPAAATPPARPEDFLAFVQGEVLLSLTEEKGKQSARRGAVDADGRPVAALPAAMTAPDNLIFIVAPDIHSMPPGKDAATTAAAEAASIIERERDRLVPMMDRLLQLMLVADEDGSRTIDRVEFCRAFEALNLEPAIPKSELLVLFAYMDADGGGTVELDDLALIFDVDGERCEAGFDQEAALMLMADMADVILVLLDGKRSRINAAELSVLKKMHKQFPAKLNFACADNHAGKDALVRSLSDLLSDPAAIAGLPALAPDQEEIIPFVTQAVNTQQQQVSSLLRGFADNMHNILARISHLYADAKVHKEGGAVTDPGAIALLNDFVTKALNHHVRSIPKCGGALVLQLKRALKKARDDSEALLRASHIKPLSLEQRQQRWRDEEELAAAAYRSVRDKEITSWDSARHVQAWLEAQQVGQETQKIFKANNVACVQDLLRVDDDKLDRWKVPLGDRLRIRKGLGEVRKQVARCSSDFLKDGLWWLLATEKHNQERVKVKVPKETLYDQGSTAAPNLRGLRTGDSIMLESALHGKVMVKVPERAQLEARNFELEVDRLKGRPAYLAADDLGVMYGLLIGDIESAEGSKAMLRDGLHLLLTGDAPPQLLHDVVCDLRLEVEDTLGYGWCQAFADDKENTLRATSRNQVPSSARQSAKVHGRRWKLEEAEREAVLSSSDSEEEGGPAGEAAGDTKSWQDKLPHLLLEIWEKVSGGGVVAEGHALEEAMLQHRRLRVLLGSAGVEFGYGSIKLLQEADVLKSEFLRDVRKALDQEVASSSGLSGEESDDLSDY